MKASRIILTLLLMSTSLVTLADHRHSHRRHHDHHQSGDEALGELLGATIVSFFVSSTEASGEEDEYNRVLLAAKEDALTFYSEGKKSELLLEILESMNAKSKKEVSFKEMTKELVKSL